MNLAHISKYFYNHILNNYSLLDFNRITGDWSTHSDEMHEENTVLPHYSHSFYTNTLYCSVPNEKRLKSEFLSGSFKRFSFTSSKCLRCDRH